MTRVNAHAKKPPCEGRRRGATGFTLIEVLVAAVLLLIVFFGLAQVMMRGRRQVDLEEERRKATAVAQARLDGLRSDYRYDTLPALDTTDTTFVVENKSFQVSHQVTPGTPEPQATTIALTVTWSASINGSPVARTLTATTMLGRGMP
jgi:prepilin-type N-terminal cleavage/methylation domain-containing protein